MQVHAILLISIATLMWRMEGDRERNIRQWFLIHYFPCGGYITTSNPFYCVCLVVLSNSLYFLRQLQLGCYYFLCMFFDGGASFTRSTMVTGETLKIISWQQLLHPPRYDPWSLFLLLGQESHSRNASLHTVIDSGLTERHWLDRGLYTGEMSDKRHAGWERCVRDRADT